MRCRPRLTDDPEPFPVAQYFHGSTNILVAGAATVVHRRQAAWKTNKINRRHLPWWKRRQQRQELAQKSAVIATMLALPAMTDSFTKKAESETNSTDALQQHLHESRRAYDTSPEERNTSTYCTIGPQDKLLGKVRPFLSAKFTLPTSLTPPICRCRYALILDVFSLFLLYIHCMVYMYISMFSILCEP